MFEKTINTSRKRAISAPAGSKSARSRGSVQRVELTVDDRPYSQVLHNGVRPHGGYRGTNKHPPGLYSEYENPLDQFSLTQPLPSSATPSETSTMPTAWMSSMFKESSHSEESPLFIHKLLSPDKSIQKGRSSMSARRSANSSKGSRCSSSVHYYRPDRPHDYLSATQLSPDKEIYGRQTRTTVLRARERCTSVPVNAYDARKELLRKLENRYRSAQANSAGFSWKNQNQRGESMHSFLTGARYNRAHTIDAKGLDHGVYLSRNNPLGCFTTKKVRPSKDLSKRAEKASEEPSKADIPFKSPDNPPPSPRSSACTWDDNILVQVDIPPDDNRKEDNNTLVVLSESLNVKGSKMPSRPRSASAAHSSLSQLKIKPRPKSAYPAIVIEGGRKFCFESDHADVTDAEVENGGKKKEEEKEEGKEDQVLRKIDVRVDFFVTEKSHDSERENGKVDVIIPPNQ